VQRNIASLFQFKIEYLLQIRKIKIRKMKIDLENKIALVARGNDDIGKAICAQLNGGQYIH
jgi:hypothetical protein